MSPSQKTRPKPKTKPRRKPPTLGQTRTKPWVRVSVMAIVALLAIGSLGAVLLSGNGTDRSSVSGSTIATLPSVAGKPCVAVTDPLPTGSPAVPVEVGPPPTQLVVKDLAVGTGATVEATSNISADYIGVACSSGKIFGTSYGDAPADFSLVSVIPGWRQGIPGMKVGGTRLLGIPSAMAYGKAGGPPGVKGDEALWFVVQVKSVQPTG